ncbi:STAS domain-containing protein [Streptomyces sp. NPDC006553]|uniref:STAS domain-containing protein n=1 Tax=unclassified Streptomyces TaxID=2593676 RepID=UPI0022513A1C|nr:STAS domain-containing protein [Streptomyces sp. NBC_00233]MCX5231913.1 STAS domain-containing protein [Streptomyces sp. NBC_00233]
MPRDATGSGDAGLIGPRLTATVRWHGATAVVTVEGELDRDTQEPLQTALTETLDRRPERIVVSCERLTFCDSTGLNLLLTTRLDALEAGSRLELAALRPPVDRVFDVTGVVAVFTVYDELPAELAEGEHP